MTPSCAVGNRLADDCVVTGIIESASAWMVYRCHSDRWDCDVVVKMPRAEVADPDALRTLTAAADEWTALGAHPYIASCYCACVFDGVPALVIEYAERGNLRTWLAQQQRPDLRNVLDLAIQFCHGLGHTHSRGTIHRALKAENVLLAADGTLKLTDFGIAAPWNAPAKIGNGNVPAIGHDTTGAYIAPEQWVGEAHADARADLFALGVCLYEMVCRRRPYDLTHGARREPADPRELWDGAWKHARADGVLPSRLRTLMMRCVDWDRERRPSSAIEVRHELQAIYVDAFAEPSAFAEVPGRSAEAEGWDKHAFAYLMFDRAADAEAAWEAARAADRNHVEAAFNLGLSRWRRGTVTDQGLVEQLRRIEPRRYARWRAKYLLALVHLERGAVDEALPLLEEAAHSTADHEVSATLHRAQAGDFANANCLGVIEGHGDYVTAAAISGDARVAISGSRDHTLRVWDVPTGRCLRVLEGHRHQVLAVAMTADGRLAISSGEAEPLRLWEVESGRCLRALEGAAGQSYGIALTADGRLALSTGVSGAAGPDVGAVQLWDVETGRRRAVLHGHTSLVKAVAVTPDGDWAVSGSDDRTARVWEVATGRCVHVLEGHQHRVSAVYISPDARWAVTGSWDETVRLWDLASARCIRTFAGHLGLVSAVHMLADTHRVLSGSWDRTLRLWDMDTGRCLRTFEGHRGMVTSAHLLTGGRRALSASWDLSLRLWQTPAIAIPDVCRLRSSLPATDAGVTERSASPTDQPANLIEHAVRAIADSCYPEALEYLRRLGTDHGKAASPDARQVWRRLSRHCQRTGLRMTRPASVLTESDVICSTALSSSGRWIVSGSRDCSARLWDVATEQCVQTWEGHSDRVTCVQLSADERWMLSGSADRTVRLWDVDAGLCERIFTGHTSLVTAACFSGTGRWVLSGSYDHTVRLWDVATGQCARILAGHTRQISSVSLSRDGRHALSGALDRTLRLWDLIPGRCLRVFEGHQRAVTCVQFGADGATAVSGSDDGAVCIWDTSTGRCLHRFGGHTGRVTSVQLSIDGRWAVSTGHDRTVRVWDVQAQRCHTALGDLAGRVNAAALSDDACWLVTGGEDHALRIWEIEWELAARDAIDWDEQARPHLAIFLALHPPRRLEEGAVGDHTPVHPEPSWNEEDFQRLLAQLQCAGYGWLRPEGVRRELHTMSETWPSGASLR